MRDRTRAPGVASPLVLVAAVLVAVTAAAAGTSAPEDPPAHRSRLVLADGATAIAVGPVERRDGLLLYRTPGGTLASVPADRVASIEDVPPAAAPADAPAGAVRVEAVDAPEVIDNDALPTAPLPAVVGGIVAGADAGASGDDRPVTPDPDVPIPTYDTYRDRDGRDEAWWRARVAAIEADRAQAVADRDRWNRRFAEVSALVRLECRGDRFGSTSVRSRCAELLAIQDEARAGVEDAEARLAEVEDRRKRLSEEARRAGALPGWLR